MKRWPTKTLGELAGGGQYGLNAAAMSEGTGVRFIRITDITQAGELRHEEPAFVPKGTPELDDYELKEGDVLIARSGATVGKNYIHHSFGERAVFAGYLIRFQPDTTKVLPRFIGAFLQTPDYWQQLNSHKRAVAQPNVNAKQLASFVMPVPPLAEQERIVKLLDEADELQKLRATADRRTANLIPSLFHKMFNRNKFKTVRVGELTSLVTSGSTPRGGDAVYVKEGPYFIRSQNVQMNRLTLTDAGCLPIKVHEQMSRTKVAVGDVLLNITGASIGRVAWVEKLDREANVSQHVCLIRPKADLLNATYLSVFMSLPTTQNFILQIQSGASRQALNHQQVRALEIPLPPLSLQREFAGQVEEIRALEASQAASRKRLDELFQSLLHRTFEGEL